VDLYGQPKHRTLFSYGHLATQRHGPCCSRRKFEVERFFSGRPRQSCFLVTGCSEFCLSSGERRTLHSRTSPNTNPDANTDTNPNVNVDTNPNINADAHSDSYAMRWEMLTDAKATSHPGTASVVCRDMVRKENGSWKLIENSLYTTKETIVTS